MIAVTDQLQLRNIADGRMPCPRCAREAFLNAYDELRCIGFDDDSCDYRKELDPDERRHAIEALPLHERAWIADYRALIADWRQRILSREPTVNGLGLWFVHRHPDAVGRNPVTGEPLVISGRTNVYYLPSEAFLSSVLAPPYVTEAQLREIARDHTELHDLDERCDGPVYATGIDIPHARAGFDASFLEPLVRAELKDHGRSRFLSLGELVIHHVTDGADLDAALLAFDVDPDLRERLST